MRTITMLLSLLLLISSAVRTTGSICSSPLELSYLQTGEGTVLEGYFSYSGYSASSLGDINGDGVNDIVLGSDRCSNCYGTSTYIVFGGSHLTDTLTLSLRDLDGSNGFRVYGADGYENIGWSVSGAGDVNGDGFDDVLIGGPDADPAGVAGAGEAYVIFGGPEVGSGGSLYTSTLNGVNGFIIRGSTTGGHLGYSSSSGDVNNDGYSDLYISAPSAKTLTVVYGGENVGSSGALLVNSLNGSDGFNVVGDDYNFGFIVSSVGDINSDSYDDIAIVGNDETLVVFGSGDMCTSGNCIVHDLDMFTIGGMDVSSISGGCDVNGDSNHDIVAGDITTNTVHVIYGGGEVGNTGSIDVNELTSEEQLIIEGTGGSVGNSVSCARDMNLDGLDDILIGAYTAAPHSTYEGETYVIFSGYDENGVISLDGINGGNGYTIYGVNSYDYSGWVVAGVGDVNGDLLDDVLITAYNANDGKGESYLIYCTSDLQNTVPPTTQVTATPTTDDTFSPTADSLLQCTNPLELQSMQAGEGITINGESSGDKAGYALGTADVNGDGELDILIGSPYANDEGAVYVVLGQESLTSISSMSLSDLDGSNGYVIRGVNNANACGWTVSGTGDVNGDGFDDILIGAPYADPNGVSSSGEVYVLFGGTFVGSSGVVYLNTLDGSNGFTIRGSSLGDIGYRVSRAGDVNGDGYNDIMFTCDCENANLYVVFGGEAVGGTGLLYIDDIDGYNGFVIESGHHCGGCDNDFHIDTAGDFNGDGYDDILFGLSNSYVYIIFGAPDIAGSGFQFGYFELADLDGTNGFRISCGLYNIISSVAGGCDVNGDGSFDIIVADGGSSSERTYVLFGGDGVGSSGLVDLDTLSGQDGFIIEARFVKATSCAGDIDHDGIADFILGLPYQDIGDDENVGETAAIFAVSVPSGQFRLGDIDGSNGFTMNGVDDGDNSGSQVLGVGSHVVTAASYANNDRGAVYLIFCTSTPPQTESPNYSPVPTLEPLTLSPSFPAIHFVNPVDIDELDGVDGMTWMGEGNSDQSGYSVSALGDINGDGLPDLIIGAPFASTSNSGCSYVIFGSSSLGNTAVQSLNTLNGINGFTILGFDSGGEGGYTVCGAGDINGDGFNDLVIGAPYAASNMGESYVIFGGSSIGSNGVFDVTTLDGKNGFVIVAPDGATDSLNIGRYQGKAGDINGDGFDDFMIGLPALEVAFVVYGSSSVGDAGVLVLENFDGTNGITIVGSSNLFGYPLNSIGDVNNDGYDDVYVDDCVIFGSSFLGGTGVDAGIIRVADLDGSDGFKSSCSHVVESVTGCDVNGDGINDIVLGASAVYVMYGSPSIGSTGAVSMSALSGPDGFIIYGIDYYDGLGYSVSCAGDINHDGVDDIVAGAPYADPYSDNEGTSYVVFVNSVTSGVYYVSQLDGSSGFSINGAAADDNSGYAVAGVGDMNADGQLDVVVTSINSESTGATSILFNVYSGHTHMPSLSPTQHICTGGACDLSELNGNNGFVFDGNTAGSQSGYAISCNGDINGDGMADIVVGSPGNSTTRGSVTIIFGGQTSDPEFDDSYIDGQTGFVIDGMGVADNFGFSVGFTDCNGDGFDDVIIGAPNAGSAGMAYVIFGGSAVGSSGVVTVDSMDGLVIEGVTDNEMMGYAVGSAGDINADGFDDIAIGAIKGGNNQSGSVYILFGGNDIAASNMIMLSNLSECRGFVIDGIAAGDETGFSLSSVGDMNGDGFEDLAVGAPSAYRSGAVYVIFGGHRTNRSIDAAALDGSNGWILYGEKPEDRFGHSVSAAGDINDDGYNDIAIGAPHSSNNGFIENGATYLMYGWHTMEVGDEIPSVNNASYVIIGCADYDHSGTTVVANGNFGGGPRNDVVIGSPNADSHGESTGAVYVLYDSLDMQRNGTFYLNSLDVSTGLVINGLQSGDNTGSAVSFGTDINGDRAPDLVIGAGQADPSGLDSAGSSYVLYGSTVAIDTPSPSTVPTISSSTVPSLPHDPNADDDTFDNNTIVIIVFPVVIVCGVCVFCFFCFFCCVQDRRSGQPTEQKPVLNPIANTNPSAPEENKVCSETLPVAYAIRTGE